MGMFDDIKSEYPLPLPENQGEFAGRNWPDNGFQTKDFDCLMDQYCIHEDGTLWQQTYALETTRKGWPRRQPIGWEPMRTYTGTVRFYDSIKGQKVDYSVEWAAVFVAGKITELKLERWDERDNRDRLACEAKWKRENEKRERFLATWIGRRVYPPYAWIVHGCLGMPIHNFCHWVGRLCDRAGRWLDRVGHKLAPYGDPIRGEKRRRAWESTFNDDD